MEIHLDPDSGFCFGVVRAIELAQDQLLSEERLLCLGDIVHNEEEVKRLTGLGLETIYVADLERVRDVPILFRAHGEPPATYALAAERGLRVIDATCPVVLKLQQRVARRGAQLKEMGGQILIYGKPDHAEVNGLLGQTDCDCWVVQGVDDLAWIDFGRPTDCFSQTTMSPSGYSEVVEGVRERMLTALGGAASELPLRVHRTTCGQVSHRSEQIAAFAKAHDTILFVSGRKSSNGRMLYQECQLVNPRSYFITSAGEVEVSWLKGAERLGICGATSTPRWLMESVAERVRSLAG